MRKKEQVKNALLAQKILPLYYHESAAVSTDILKALYDGGIRIVEYTNRGEKALENFKVLRATAENAMPGLQLGIGTIKTKKQATAFIEAGADFIVCPSINEEVGEVAENAGLLWIPGCMTPTEIATAEGAGAKIAKLFPGNLLGPSYVKSVQEIFPNLRFIITGGVKPEAENIRAWFNAGVVGVGMGSKLISKELVEQKDYERLRKLTADTMEMVARLP